MHNNLLCTVATAVSPCSRAVLNGDYARDLTSGTPVAFNNVTISRKMDVVSGGVTTAMAFRDQVGTGLEHALDALVPHRIASAWPFRQPRYRP